MTNSVFLCLEGVKIEISNHENDSLLKNFYEQYRPASSIDEGSSQVDLVLSAKDNGLCLQWNSVSAKPLFFNIDVEKIVKQLRSFPAPKQGAFNQALGKKTRTVIDATGGWGGDAILMCCQGYDVSVIERQPIMALMLVDAMQRLSQTNWAVDNGVKVPSVIHANAGDYFSSKVSKDDISDCVYLDPMFPPKKKKSAAVNKQMQLLQWLVGEDEDASELLNIVLESGVKRVSVKRPDYAEPLLKKPSNQFSSKLVHYDVYLAS